LPLAVDSNVQNVLGVVFEFEPTTHDTDDFPEEVAAVIGALEENAGRACNWETMTRSVPLMMNVPFSVIQRNVAVENFLLLDVADGLRAGIGSLS